MVGERAKDHAPQFFDCPFAGRGHARHRGSIRYFPHGMIGTVEIEFCGEPSMILSLIAM